MSMPSSTLVNPADDLSSPKLLDRQALGEAVRALSVPRNWRSVLAIATQYAVIAAAMAAAVWSGKWYVYVLAAIIVGTRQHALGILMHDAAHYRLFTNRFLNDTVSDLLCAFPIGVSTSVYRKYHFAHHKYVNTELDPDIQKVVGDDEWSWPKTQYECFKIFAQDLLLLNLRSACFFMWFWSPWRGLSKKPGSPALTVRERLCLVGLYAGVPIAVTLLHAWPMFLLLWVLPCFTVLAVIFRLRNLAEHYGVASQHELDESRNVLPNWWERLVISPLNVNHHLDHHLFPSVPWYNLPKLHRLLMREPEYAARAHITRSYTGLRKGVLGELLATPQEVPATQPAAA
jgi:fatty acid desaturase